MFSGDVLRLIDGNGDPLSPDSYQCTYFTEIFLFLRSDIRGKQVGTIGPLLLGPPGTKVSLVLERYTAADAEPQV